MTKIIFAMFFGLFLSGCIILNSAPKENLEFSQSADIQDLKGIYKNLGDPASLYLSELIWRDRTPSLPTDPFVKDIRGNLVREQYIIDKSGIMIRDSDIDFVEVISREKSLKINAIKGQCIVSRKEYVVGRDFTLTEGKIILRKEVHSLTRGSGDPIVGPSYEKVELGLDAKGNGKYKSQTYFAGLVFMLFPMAGGGADEV